MKQVKKNIVILFVETGTREPKPRFGTREELDGNERTETYKNFRKERDLRSTAFSSIFQPQPPLAMPSLVSSMVEVDHQNHQL